MLVNNGQNGSGTLQFCLQQDGFSFKFCLDHQK